MNMQTVNVMNEIREDMTVYDVNEDQVGTVKQVQFSDEQPDQPGPETESTSVPQDPREDTLVNKVAEAIFDNSQMPDEVRQRLLNEGFVRIDTGLLHADRFALPEHIARVEGEKVYLRVVNDELIRNR
jgi:hypothetical protein